jgi:predicted outer membrane repeat protein
MFSTKSLVHFISFFLLLALILSPVSPARAADVRYAAPVAVGSGNCSSWANACTLQTALSGAASGDEIWVKKGVHYPGAAGNRTATFTLKNDVALYGGFAGTETLLSQRAWQTNLTILSGDIDQNDINNDHNNIAETWNDIQGNNAYHIVTGGGTNNTAVLDGFVITAGQANGNLFPYNAGGGMYNYQSSPALTNVTFSGNSAGDGGGGGMYNYQSSPALTDVTFSGNSANYGGGMYDDSSSPALKNVTFSGNSAGSVGGGMYNYGSSPTLTNVIFNTNTATSAYGGGMSNGYNSNPKLTNVTFSNNSSPDGGGIFSWSSSPTLTNVVFSGNSASQNGGGMYNQSGTSTLTDVTFSGNSASYNGGGMYNYNSSPTLTNVTFSHNSGGNYGGGMHNSNSSPTLTNVIMWGDTAINGPEISNDSTTPAISYSDIHGCGNSVSGWNTACGTDSGGNIDADPYFVDAAGGNLRLQLTSPAIDAGNNAAVPSGVTTDLDGKPRFCDIPTVPNKGNGTPPIVDIGAYEATTVFLPLVLR